MFGLGMPELIVIMGITFMIFGGKKLPELGAGLGKGIKAFKTGLHVVEYPAPPSLEENASVPEEMSALKN